MTLSPLNPRYPKQIHPADWKAGKVTVCIAAIAENGKKIVMASDSRAAFGTFSSDRGVMKNIPIGHYYAVLVAGNDVVYAMPTINRVKKLMPDDMTDPDDIAMLLHEELVETQKRKIEAKILKKLGFTMTSFMAKGKKLLTESVYYDLVSEIRREELSLTFLLSGYDSSGTAHIRVVTSDDSPQDFDLLGFAAIGSGAANALSSLAFAKDYCSYSDKSDMYEATYHVLAAKFMAESATDVGRETFFVCVSPNGDCHFLNPYAGTIDPIREAWEEHGAPRRSEEALQVIKSVICGAGEKADNLEVLERAKKYASPSHKATIEYRIKQLDSGK